MFVLFDEAGKFLAGRVLSRADASLQVELDSGRRLKVKAANALLPFDRPAPAEMLAQAQAQADGIDLELAWEFAPEDEFAFSDLAQVYFSEAPTPVQQAAALLKLQDAPHYFRRAGKGRFRKAPAEVVQQALAAIEKKKQVQAQIDQWAQALAQGECPQPVREQLYRILFKPDKNAPEYKAVVEATRISQRSALDLLRHSGAIASPYEFHWQRFAFEHFPKGTAFPTLVAPGVPDGLPLAQVQAYSIDDSQTTEIDDALSVSGLGTGQVRLGIHIAAPALAFAPGSPIDQLGRQRMSTVYMPGHKITMLPDEVVQSYTLAEGRNCPAVSLYVTFQEDTLDILGSETLLEQVPIAANLRHDQLDRLVTPEWLTQQEGAAQGPEDAALGQRLPHAELSFLYRLATQLKARREVVRGKPESFNRPDYNFRLLGHDGGPPSGEEQVQITVRQRGAPLDLIVAEAMILANSTWGDWMAQLGVPAIYRSQASLAPGIKVRMGVKALPHAGIGVSSYAWSTSPLRRYTDLVNQWQIVACARHGRTAALAAPFKPKDAELFSIISAFDAAYSAYNTHQSGMERFWTLKHLQQQGLTEITARIMKDAWGAQPALARADDLPLVLAVSGAVPPRGSHVRLKLGAIDEIALDVSAQVIERLDADAPAEPGAEGGADAEDMELDAAGPLVIAVDASESAEDAADAKASAPAGATSGASGA